VDVDVETNVAVDEKVLEMELRGVIGAEDWAEVQERRLMNAVRRVVE